MLAFPTWLLLAIGLSGCALPVSVRPLATADLDKVKGRQLAVVLFQLRAGIDGKPVSPLGVGDSNNSLRIYLANLEELAAPKLIPGASPSEAAAVAGWRYMLLPPGTYYLLILPPGVEQNPPAVAYHAPSARFGRLTQYRFEPGRGGFWSPELSAFVLAGTAPEDFRELSGFWFQVPEDKPVIYLGSLSTLCTSGRGLFGSLIDSCSDYEVVNDPQAAQQAVASSLSLTGLGAVNAVPLALYGKARDSIPLRERGPIDVVTLASTNLAAAYTGVGLAPWGTVIGAGRAIAVYNLLAIAVEAATRAGVQRGAEGRVAEVQPCMEHLSKTVAAIDYASHFIPALVEAARSLGTVLDLGSRRAPSGDDQIRGARQRLTITAPILRLRERDQRQHLALELGLDVRVEAIDTKSVAYHSLLLYAAGFPNQNPLEQRSPLYARLVSPRAQPRPMSEWCGTNGAALLTEEIGIALKHIAAQVARDLD